jgi:phosphohistidine phosphatase
VGEGEVTHRIHLLRHAKSSWDDPGLVDHDRPLAKRGRKASALLRDHLKSTGLAPDLVLCSSAVRAVQTLERLRDGLPAAIPVEVERGLYEAGAGGLLECLQALPEQVGSVLVVAHNPGIEDLAVGLAGAGDEAGRARMESKYPTGGLASLRFEGRWPDLAPGAARLESFIMPRELG